MMNHNHYDEEKFILVDNCGKNFAKVESNVLDIEIKFKNDLVKSQSQQGCCFSRATKF